MSQEMKRVVVNDKFTYKTDLPVEIGSRVVLPTDASLVDVLGPTWEGTVTSLTSNYQGPCRMIFGIAKSFDANKLDSQEDILKVEVSFPRAKYREQFKKRLAIVQSLCNDPNLLEQYVKQQLISSNQYQSKVVVEEIQTFLNKDLPALLANFENLISQLQDLT